MSPQVHRRKLQKKAKRLRYGKCKTCGWMTTCRVHLEVSGPDGYRYKLVRSCYNPQDKHVEILSSSYD